MLRYLVLAGLFFALSPGNFLTLPRGGSKRTVAMVHALAFVVAYYLSEKVAEMLMVDLDEGFKSIQGEMVAAPTVTPIFLGGSTGSMGLGKKPPTNDTLERFWGEYYMECIDYMGRKDEEYRANGDTPKYRDLLSNQLKACDRAQYAADELDRLGVDYTDTKRNMDVQRALHKYNDYVLKCDSADNQMIKEQVKNGNTPYFQELRRRKDQICDEVKYAKNRLTELGQPIPPPSPGAPGPIVPWGGSTQAGPGPIAPVGGSTGSMGGSTGSMGGSTGSMGWGSTGSMGWGSTGSMGGSKPTTMKPDAIRVPDMFGRGFCVNPYNCVRGTGWTRGLSTCKCLNNKPPLAVFRDASIPAHVMQYVKYK
jgi:hypothetical protein